MLQKTSPFTCPKMTFINSCGHLNSDADWRVNSVKSWQNFWMNLTLFARFTSGMLTSKVRYKAQVLQWVLKCNDWYYRDRDALLAVVKRSNSVFKVLWAKMSSELMLFILSPSDRYMSKTMKGPVLQASGHFGVNSDRFWCLCFSFWYRGDASYSFPVISINVDDYERPRPTSQWTFWGKLWSILEDLISYDRLMSQQSLTYSILFPLCWKTEMWSM